MAHKHLFLTILSMVLLMLVLVGCSPTQAEPTPTPAEPTPTQPEPTLTQAEPTPTQVEPTPTPIIPTLTPEDSSIVWSDDFEDGEMEDWGQDLNPGTFFFVEEGVLHSGPDRAGDIYHESNVSSGTWSFDVFFPTDESLATNTITFCVSCDQDYSTGVGFESMVKKNTAANVVILDKGVLSRENEVFLGKQLSGWNHYDVTRDDLGNTNIYLNGDLILEYSDELNISPKYFYIATDIIGPFFDNLVVRNQVIDIQPVE